MRRRAVITVAVIVIVAAVGVLCVQGARAWAFTADRHRRAQEIVARESYLYRQLANQDAVLESQRRIYMERFRRLESLLRQREDDVTVLRAVIARRVEHQSSSPSTGGKER